MLARHGKKIDKKAYSHQKKYQAWVRWSLSNDEVFVIRENFIYKNVVVDWYM